MELLEGKPELLEGKPELLEGDARILDMPFNSDVGNPEVDVKAVVPQNMSMQDQMKQLMNLQTELKETMTRITEAVKAKTDAHSVRVKKEISREDKMVKKDIAAGGTAVVCAAKDKTIPLAISNGFQSAVNQLEKSVNSKLEATVSREIQAQFQTSGKQALQDALEFGMQASMVPAFEKLCEAMFEKVNATIQKGMGEHETAAQQHVESAHSLLAHTIREAKRSALSATQTLSGKVALAAGRGNSSAVDPRVSQLTSGFHKKVEVPLDPTKEPPRLVAEGKYEPLAQPHSVEEDQEQSAKVSGSATATTMSQLQTLYANSRKQEWKNTQASGPSSPSPGVLNSIESSNEAGGSSSPPSGEAAVPQIMSMHEMMIQQMDMQRILQDHITKMIMVRPDDVFSLLYPAIMCKHPTHPMTPITPSEILMAASSFDSNTASSSYEQKMKLIADCADMLRRNNSVYDAEHKKKEEAEHKKKKIAQDEVSSVLNPRIMFKHPTHPSTPITPSEILMAACSSENTNTVDCNTASSSYVQLMELPEGKPELLEGDARILDMLFNSDVGNPEVEVKVVGDARSTEIDEFVPQRELQNAVSESKEKFSCSQTSDLGIGVALN